NLVSTSSFPSETYRLKLLEQNNQISRYSLDESFFENLFIALQVISGTWNMETILAGCENVVEEACKISCRVLDSCYYEEDPRALALDGYLYTIANIYLASHPNAIV